MVTITKGAFRSLDLGDHKMTKKLNKSRTQHPGWAALSVLGLAAVITCASAEAQSTLAWMNKSLTPDKRAELLVAAMTLEQKVQQIALKSGPNPDLPTCLKPGQRHLEGIPALAIPTWRATNGPIGVAGGDCDPSLPSTGLPTALGVAASFDRDAANMWGDIAGKEVRAIGHHALWGPGMNMGRIAQGGRNFEYFGEDPYLTGTMATIETIAIQKSGVQATGKHFAANEQETQRQTMNTIVDKRTLHEIYLLPFEMAIKDGDMSAVMCSYPRLNGTFACQNADLLTDILRKELGFKGYVVSDRGATNSTGPSINAGLDLELNSTPKWMTLPLVQAALDTKEITIDKIDGMLKNRYQIMFKQGQFDNPIVGTTPIDFQAHGQMARYIAQQSMTLMKNSGNILPLNARSLTKVALIGPSDFTTVAKIPKTGPGGTQGAIPNYSITPQVGLQNVLTSLGSTASVTVDTATNLAAAASLAASSDIAIVMVGDNSVEGADRNLSLGVRNTVDQDALIAAVVAANPKTIVVLKNGGAVLMPWLDSVPALVAAWLPGQEDGQVVAETLFGLVNPSGKLPLTFPNKELEGASSTTAQFPGTTVDGILTATYSEKLNMGYRWYDATGTKALFPFGHGLSYTTFQYSGVSADSAKIDGTKPVTVKFKLKNTGDRQGAEVAQLYASFPAQYNEPPKRLVGFEKVLLTQGEERQVSITVDPLATNHPLSYYDEATSSWKLMEGEIKFIVARSAEVLEGTAAVTLAAPAAQVPEPANDDSGGCTIAPNAKFDPVLWLLVLVGGLGLMVRRRTK